MKIFSVDLGLTGFVSVLNFDDEKIEVLDYFKIEVEDRNKNLIKDSNVSNAVVKKQVSFLKNCEKILDNISENDKKIIGIFENVGVYSKNNSCVTMMSLADTACSFRCIFENLDIDYFQINAKKWKSFFGISASKDESKELFYNLVKNKEIISKNIDLSKFKNHNLIESVLIGVFYIKYNK